MNVEFLDRVFKHLNKQGRLFLHRSWEPSITEDNVCQNHNLLLVINLAFFIRNNPISHFASKRNDCVGVMSSHVIVVNEGTPCLLFNR